MVPPKKGTPTKGGRPRKSQTNVDEPLKARLERLRLDRNESQTAFAKKCKVTPTNMDLYLRGKVRPGFVVLSRIARETKVCLNWLVIGDGEPQYRGEAWKRSTFEEEFANRVQRRVDEAARHAPFRAGRTGPLIGEGWGWTVDAPGMLRDAIDREVVALRAWSEWEGGAGAADDCVSQIRERTKDSGILRRVDFLAAEGRTMPQPPPPRPNVLPAIWTPGVLARRQWDGGRPSSGIIYQIEISVNGGEWKPYGESVNPAFRIATRARPSGTKVHWRIRAVDLSDGAASGRATEWFQVQHPPPTAKAKRPSR